ncbi:MAG: glycoside hydrolase family 19 protein [Candidatus Paceibacterota bacterium]
MKILEEHLKKIAIKPNNQIIKDVVFYLNKHLLGYGVTTPLRISHFLAQAAHESANFRTLEEYASGAAYEGRKNLGNTQKGDGKRFKGRGIFQLTGRANYKTYGEKLGIDLISNPDLAKTPEVSVLTALEYWKSKNLNLHADNDDVLKITKLINGGTNGLADRKVKLKKAKAIFDNPLNVSVDLNLVEITNEDKIKFAQRKLIHLGYTDVGDLDGKVGTFTKGAISAFTFDWNAAYPDKTFNISEYVHQLLINKLVEAERLGFKRRLSKERETATINDLRQEGSVIISGTDKIKAGGMILAAGTGIKEASDAGIFGAAQEASETVGQITEVISPFQYFLTMFAEYWFIAVFVLILVVVYFAFKAAKSRIQDHRSGNTRVVNL